MDRKRLKILYLIQLPPPVHGVSTINSLIYNSDYINEGFEKCLLELKFSDGLQQLRRVDFGKIIKFFSLSRKLRESLKRENPDFVYFSIMPVGKGFWRDLMFVMILKRHKVRIIYHLHNRGISDRLGNIIWRFFYRYVFSNSVLFHLSEGLIRQEINPLRLQGVKTFALNNGIPDIKSTPPEEKPPELSLLFLSNFFPEKGIYDVLKIMTIIKRRDDRIHLRFAGNFLRNKYRNKLMRLISIWGLEDRVTIVGPKYGKEKEQEYMNADVFIFPSYFRQECFPLVLLEAMSCSLPIISSNIGAIPEIIENGKQGILCNARNIDGFVEAILELAENTEKRKSLGQLARKKFEENYTIGDLERNTRDIFEKIVFK